MRSAIEVAPAAAERSVGDDDLRGLVVRRAEVDGLLALVGDRELLQVEVEVLRAGRDGLVEGGAHPDDVVLGEAELLGDGVGDGGLEALAGLRVRRR